MLVHLNRFARRFRLRRVDNAPVEFEALINLRATQTVYHAARTSHRKLNAMQVRTLNELMAQHSSADRAIVYHSGENESRRVTYAQMHDRALGILHHLQQLGAKPGDRHDPATQQQ